AAIENAAEVRTPSDVATLLGFTLALNAGLGIGQGLQASQRNHLPAPVAATVVPFAHPLKGRFDMGELTAFDLRELRADLVLCRIEGSVNDIARILLAQLLEQA